MQCSKSTWKAHSGHGGVSAEFVSKRRKSGSILTSNIYDLTEL